MIRSLMIRSLTSIANPDPFPRHRHGPALTGLRAGPFAVLPSLFYCPEICHKA